MGCLFCNIVEGKVPAKLAYENEHVVAFHDIRPMAPTHVLVIPRKHIVGIGEATDEDVNTLGQVMLAGRRVAETLKLEEGYRLVVNNGENAGQSVFHLHLHVLGGRPLAWPPG
ncbi:histidine triad nucleotide-binding protein [Pendulispora brunnea]|uniref:Histidine triad nucleotide-binding protein n=1 Tax=Pendulispora brunnea TaxID=2905690 RepID=A0ABZ2KEN2_9BACT